MQVATSAASGRTRIPRIFSRGDHLLHDGVQILQPRRTAERRAAHIDVVGYRVVAEVGCIGEGVQPVREVELVPHHFAIAVCISELSVHACMRPKAMAVMSLFLQAKNDGRTRPSGAPQVGH